MLTGFSDSFLVLSLGSSELIYENGGYDFWDDNMIVAKVYQELPPLIRANGINPYGSSEYSNYCGSSANLSADLCSGTVNWYKRTRLFTVPVTYRWDFLATGNPYGITPSNSVFQATCTVDGLTSPASSSLTTFLLDLPTPTVSPVATTITAGSSATLIAIGCPVTTLYQFNNGALPNLYGYVEVSPAATTVYTTRCQNGTCVGSSVSTTVVVQNPCPANTSISAQSGDWNATSTWTCGGVPTLTSLVQIKTGHVITVSSAVNAKRIQFETAGTIRYAPAGRLRIDQ